ncbi:MAG: 7-carboxy-7-deazaguanine synthase [uncultured Sphingomonadaceae bacterium]|uniref:7-carboxy-7-deazaguanine synthase n=1 Tax=uncultured Sphingomonadaceae bacterium TaxID=169976 RepID=A0A6J4RYW1_9SPHN|nr:MAG: 7-carboxy-7-deazaguanine synthase [uncultured Sphingomonadaceae bacterium]
MSYAVKEMFLTLQGEGARAGRRAVFVRFAGCNLWSGVEAHRATAACRFCDTEFVGLDGEGGGRFSEARALAGAAARLWGETSREHAYAVLTGGEPLLQVNRDLIEALHAEGFEIAVETNGTLPAPPGLDWVCVSPKAGTEVVQRRGDELKLVWPQSGIDPAELRGWDFAHFLVQPMDCSDAAAAREAAVALAMADPGWRLSLQTHKLLGLR